MKAALKAGADVNARDEDGQTAFMEAASFNENPDVVKALTAAGADVNARDEIGTTALMYAALSNINPNVIKVLLAAGADKYARNGSLRAIDYLEIRDDKFVFSKTSAYWEMRELLY